MDERRPVLLTVSGVIPADLDAEVAAGVRPRADYRVLAERLDADVVDVPIALARAGRVGGLIQRLGGAGLLLGWDVFRQRKRYRVILTDGEQVGLPFALLSRLFGAGGTRHVMIVHVLSVPKKSLVLRWAGLATSIDRFLVYCRRQMEFILDELDVAPEQVVLTPFMVDTRFFSPDQLDVAQRPMICSAGLERRDYPTLMEAVEGLDVDVVIAAASPWSRQGDSSEGRALPANVTIERLSLYELRELYARSRVVVMPLVEVDFQAGITTILEAMAMARPVVCTRTNGQTDTIVEGVTGRYVPPSDSAALRSVIEELLADVEQARALGAAGRAWAEEHADVARYSERIAGVIVPWST